MSAENQESLNYKSAGVDIAAGNELVERIKPIAARTRTAGVMAGLGGFGSMFELPLDRYQNPILVSGTDGVGTKLKLAIDLGIHDTVGIDPVWMSGMLKRLPAYHDKLLELWARVEDYCKQHKGFNARLVVDFDITWYGVIKHADRTEKTLQQVLGAVIKEHPSILDGSLYWHLNGNNLAVLPRIINKESAVDYLIQTYRQQHSDLVFFGAGDSHTDAPFMALCDYALIPRNTQLFKTLAVSG